MPAKKEQVEVANQVVEKVRNPMYESIDAILNSSSKLMAELKEINGGELQFNSVSEVANALCSAVRNTDTSHLTLAEVDGRRRRAESAVAYLNDQANAVQILHQIL